MNCDFDLRKYLAEGWLFQEADQTLVESPQLNYSELTKREINRNISKWFRENNIEIPSDAKSRWDIFMWHLKSGRPFETTSGKQITVDSAEYPKVEEIEGILARAREEGRDLTRQEKRTINDQIRHILKTAEFGSDKGSDGKTTNKGNGFEEEFCENYKEYEKDIKRIVGYTELKGKPEGTGHENNSRPIKIEGSEIILSPCTNTNFNIGRTVSDITLNTDKGPVYLSLKYGNKVALSSSGIRKLFTDEFFETGKASNELSEFLEFFHLDQDTVRRVFNDYNPDNSSRIADREVVDVTPYYQSQGMLNFLRSSMGCGYILVHKIGGEVHYIDLRKLENLNSYIDAVSEAKILYPKNGSAKRIDISIVNKHVKLLVNLRSKAGGVRPTHIAVDYTLTGE